MTLIDLTGKRFHLWTAVKKVSNSGATLWLCKCDCGTERVIDSSHLRRGHSYSCGCTHRPTKIWHGRSKSREYNSWRGAKERCYNKNNKKFAFYGGQGVTMCDEWKNSFKAFYRDMGPRPKGTSLDRYPNKTGNYEHGNCRWATQKQQTRNTAGNRLLTLNGETLCVSEWAERIGLPTNTLHQRLITLKWSTEKTLLTPYRYKSIQHRK